MLALSYPPIEKQDDQPARLQRADSRILQGRIALRMATQSEELFCEEINERAFR